MRAPVAVGPVTLSGVLQTVYTVREPARLVTIFLVNPTGLAVAAIVSVVPAGAVAATIHQIVPARELLANDFLVVGGGGGGGDRAGNPLLALQAGDTIQASGNGLNLRLTIQPEF